MAPNCDRCSHKLVCKVIEKFMAAASSMPMGFLEKQEFFDIVKYFVADECPKWNEEVKISDS